ncbi:MAG: hypothetical protein J6S67_03960 [Methanobrevibacter sp.]|nr:hypothetical protein [Methanobrevibacter sp.]
MTVKTFVQHLLEDIGNGLMYLCSWAQVEQVLRIASFVLSIIISILIIVSRILTWWKEAKKDGKITKDEIKEGVTIITEGVEEVKHQIDSHTKKGD